MTPPDRRSMKIFLSYTAEDLIKHADAATQAVRRAGAEPIDHRLWAATGTPSVEECRERVADCDLLIVIVAHRYGWVPKRVQGGDDERSITWLEVEEARTRGLEVLPFVVEEDAPWSPQHMEGLRDAVALDRLDRFKAALQDLVCAFFSTPESLEAAVAAALLEVGRRTAAKAESPKEGPPDHDEIAAYRRRVEEHYRRIRLLGFGEQFQVSLPIDELYVPLHVSVPRSFNEDAETKGSPKALERAERVLQGITIEQVFEKAREFGTRAAVLIGDPGSGKTTAARRLGWQCADPVRGPESLMLPDDVVPVLLRLRRVSEDELEGGLEGALRRELSRVELADDARLGNRLLERGRLLWILDGLDEVASPAFRATVSRWIQETHDRRRDDWFLVTSRYAGYEGEAVLDASFLEMHVQPLKDEPQRDFVNRWYQTVERQVQGAGPEAATAASERSSNLLAILQSPDFSTRRLASMVANPLLLSILCVVYRRDLDLPRRRADLYDKCVHVLLDSWRKEWRETRGHNAFDVTAARLILQPLAWHLHQKDHRADATLEELIPVVEQATNRLSSLRDVERDPARFLEAIRNDSGLLVSAEPGRYGFLHLSFQEYLAARHATEALSGADLGQRFGSSWWREPLLLALSQAENDDFVSDFFTTVLGHEDLYEHRTLLGRLVNESLLLPLPAFAARLEDPATEPEALLAMLSALADRKDPDLVVAVRGLLVHSDARVSQAARDLLLRAGDLVPAEASGAPAPMHDERTGILFLPIPSGRFMMGTPEGDEEGVSAERPVHEVALRAFELAQHPVTNAQYERFLAANPDAPKPEYWSHSAFSRPQQPVVGVSWEEAQVYCQWAGLRLPSEAEWEFACRAGTKTRFWSGDEESDLARVGWYSGNSGEKLHDVNEKAANAWGLHDVHGNAWEWCEDNWHDNYEGAPTDGSAWVAEGARSRLVRGGAFDDAARGARSAVRYWSLPSGRNLVLGFRPARSVTS